MEPNSSTLYTAASQGNEAVVRQLLASGKCEPNYIDERMDAANNIFKTSVLSAAVKSGNLPTVQLLLDRGAWVYPLEPPTGRYDIETDAISAFINNQNVQRANYDILKALFAKSTPETFSFDLQYMDLESGEMQGPLFELFEVLRGHRFPPKMTRNWIPPVSATVTCVSHYFHECLLKCHHKGLELLIKKLPYGQTDVISKDPIPVNPDTLRAYILGRKFTSFEADTAGMGIDFLLKQNFFDKFTGLSIAQEMKDVIAVNMIQKINIESLPKQLQEKLKKPSQYSVQELFARMQKILYPEVGLPSVSMTSPNFKAHKDYEASLKDVEDYQNFSRLRGYLGQMKPMEMVAFLSRFNAFSGENEAAELLAEILLYHAEDVVEIDGKEQPLLESRHISRGLEILNAFYGMDTTKQMIVSFHNEQSDMTSNTRKEVLEIKQEVGQLRDDVAKVKEVVQGMQGQMDSMFQLLKQFVEGNQPKK